MLIFMTFYQDALDSHARVLGEKDIMIKRLQNTLADKERTIEVGKVCSIW
jgi:hypothetical protein